MSTKKNFIRDPNTFSNPQLFNIEHVSLNWSIDFQQQTIDGFAILSLNLTSAPANANDAIILDTRELNVSSVVEQTANVGLNFDYGDGNAFGKPLRIYLNQLSDVANLKQLRLKIDYSTSRTASALQWFESNLTLGKRYPYLFSQCQAIHARSIVPCQDTPSVKFTYDAVVKVQKPLQVLMSAVQKDSRQVDENTVEYTFEQKIPVPSYLIAIVAADLVSRDIGPISKVWTEKEMIDQAAYEFAEVDIMLKDAQSIMGEYVWGRYDILVLPPTFPYGGMENPCLTFVTPTIISGDRTLATVVQHEITHSWTGNLVTNASWEHFWLNEGFTRCIEGKLVGLFNKSELYRHFDLSESWRCLIQAVNDFGPENQLTQLVPNLDNTDPDDAFSSIPYEKGQMLLFYLENLLGGVEIFNKYLRAHIENFKGKSIDTNDWKAYLYQYFADKKDILDKVDWNTWLYKPGMPPFNFEFDQTISKQVKELSEKLYNDEITCVDPVFEKFNSNQKRELLSQLLEKDPLNLEKICCLNDHYKLGDTRNSEILFRWLRLGIKSQWEPIIEPALKFVRDQGRMKFTRPIYRDLYNWSRAREAAIDNFNKHKCFMHQTTASLVAKDLKLV